MLICSFLGGQLYAQCIKGNCYSGQGVYDFAPGSRYVGGFKDGKMQGKGKLVLASGEEYEGTFIDGKKHGEGRFQYADKSVYIGDFYKDVRQGKGKMRHANGDEYVGQWLKDQPHGKGSYFFGDRSKYEGEFVSGKFEGKGKFTFSDGSTQEGMWRNNELVDQHTATSGKQSIQSHRAFLDKLLDANKPTLTNCNTEFCHKEEGTYTYKDGSVYMGTFINGEAAGVGTCKYANGSTYAGDWKHHAPHGRGTMQSSNGYFIDADWFNGKVTKQHYAEKRKPTYAQVKPEVKKGDGIPRIYALIVGIASYNHMRSLKYTDDDAYQLYSFFKSPEGGALPDNQVNILIDDAATKEAILKQMNKVFSQADEDDSVILYISGHGLDGYFVPYDFDGKNNLLSYNDILNAFQGFKAKSKLCITDACHSGSMASKSPWNFAIEEFYQKMGSSDGGTAIIMSSKREEVSLEYSGLRQGIFSHYLIKGLKGKADVDQDKYVSLGELFAYVRTQVQNYTVHAQNPIIVGKYDAEMPIAFVR